MRNHLYMTTPKRLFEIFEHLTGIKQESPTQQNTPVNNWSSGAIIEFMDLIGQDEQRMYDRNSGVAVGDYGRMKFKVQNNTLYMDFSTPEMAQQAIHRLSDAVSNPYEFSTRFDQMPNTVMVQFTDNGVNEGDLTYGHATNAGPDSDEYKLGMDESTNTMKLKVAQLSVGDVLSSGAKVISPPVAGLYTPAGQVEIGIQYPNGTRKTQLWNKRTEVLIRIKGSNVIQQMIPPSDSPIQ